MTQLADGAVRVFVYGSCVARDTMEFAASPHLDLLGYVARQSLLSAGNDALRHLPEELTVSSKFQERMIRSDFGGLLFTRLRQLAEDIDVLVWDLADERHGVHRFDDGGVVTRSIDNMRMPELEAPLARTTHVEFGSDEHFGLWSARLVEFERLLRDIGAFERVVVLEVPWAVFTTEGKPSPWSMGVRAKDANVRYGRYYEAIRRRGFRMIRVTEDAVLADPTHKWGLAPFHYAPEVYREVLRQLAGVCDHSAFRAFGAFGSSES